MDFDIVQGQSGLGTYAAGPPEVYGYTISVGVTVYYDRGKYLLQIPVTNTTTNPQININGIGATTVLANGSEGLSPIALNLGDLAIGSWIEVLYDKSQLSGAGAFIYLCCCKDEIVARTAFVSKSGNDATALIERPNFPFLTIAGALAAMNTAKSAYYNTGVPGTWLTPATSVDRLKIVVGPGLYKEGITLSNFIDFDLGNATLGSIFQYISITDNSVAVDSIIYGVANIFGSVNTLNTGSKLVVYATSIKAGNSIAVNCQAGNILTQVPTITNTPTTDTPVDTVRTEATAILIINNARIINNVIGYAANANLGTLIVNNCTLLSNPAKYAYSYVSGVAGIFIYGACQANQGSGPGTVENVGTVLIDIAVV